MFDDFVLYNPYHILRLFSSIEPGALRTVDIYKALYPVSESGRTGGMIKVYSRKGNTKEFQADIDASLVSSILRLQGPIPNGSYFVSARRTYLDFLTNLIGQEFPFYFYDFVGKIKYRINNINSLELSGIISRDNLEMNIKNEGAHWQNDAVGINWKAYFSNRLYLHNTFYYSHNFSTFVSDSYKIENLIRDYTVKSKINYSTPFLNSTFSSGGALHAFFIKFYSDQALQYLHKEYKTLQADFYVNWQFNLTSNIKINTGSNINYYDITGTVYINPLFMIAYTIDNHWQIESGYAHKTQFLYTINNERDIFPPFNIWRSVDKNTGAEMSDQFSFSVSNKTKMMDIKAEVYYNYLSRFVDYNRKKIYESDPQFVVNKGESYGFELDIGFPISVGALDLAYTFSRTIYLSNEVPYYPSFDRTNKINFNFLFKPFYNWNISLHWTFSNGRPYTEKSGIYYLRQTYLESEHNAWSWDRSFEYEKGYNMNRYPTYHRLDLRAQKYFSENFLFYINIINAYNRQNILYYEYEGKEFKAVQMLPILPTVGMEYRLN